MLSNGHKQLVLELAIPFVETRTLFQCRLLDLSFKNLSERTLCHRFSTTHHNFNKLLFELNTIGDSLLCSVCDSTVNNTKLHPSTKRNICETCYFENLEYTYIPVCEAVSKYGLIEKLIPPKYITSSQVVPWKVKGSKPYRKYILGSDVLKLSKHHKILDPKLITSMRRFKYTIFFNTLSTYLENKGFRVEEIDEFLNMQVFKACLKPTFYYDGVWVQDKDNGFIRERAIYYLNQLRMDFFKYHAFNETVRRELQKKRKYTHFKFNQLFGLTIWKVINPYSVHKSNYYNNNHHRVIGKETSDLDFVLDLATTIIDSEMDINKLRGNVLFNVIIQQRFNYSAPINYLDICWFL